jgi:hypothetical protein
MMHQDIVKDQCEPDDKWVRYMGILNFQSVSGAIERVIMLQFRIPLVIKLDGAMTVLQFLPDTW